MFYMLLVCIHRIALDNHVFLEFHPYFFLIKDQATKKIIYQVDAWTDSTR